MKQIFHHWLIRKLFFFNRFSRIKQALFFTPLDNGDFSNILLKIIVKNVPHCCLNNFTSASVILSCLCKLDNVRFAANHIFIPLSGKPFSFSLKSNWLKSLLLSTTTSFIINTSKCKTRRYKSWNMYVIIGMWICWTVKNCLNCLATKLKNCNCATVKTSQLPSVNLKSFLNMVVYFLGV